MPGSVVMATPRVVAMATPWSRAMAAERTRAWSRKTLRARSRTMILGSTNWMVMTSAKGTNSQAAFTMALRVIGSWTLVSTSRWGMMGPPRTGAMDPIIVSNGLTSQWWLRRSRCLVTRIIFRFPLTSRLGRVSSTVSGYGTLKKRSPKVWTSGQSQDGGNFYITNRLFGDIRSLVTILQAPSVCTFSSVLSKLVCLDNLEMALIDLDHVKVDKSEQASQGLSWEQSLHEWQRRWLSHSMRKREQPLPCLPEHLFNNLIMNSKFWNKTENRENNTAIISLNKNNLKAHRGKLGCSS